VLPVFLNALLQSYVPFMMYACMPEPICTGMYVYMLEPICVGMYVCMHVRLYGWAHMYWDVRLYGWAHMYWDVRLYVLAHIYWDVRICTLKPICGLGRDVPAPFFGQDVLISRCSRDVLRSSIHKPMMQGMSSPFIVEWILAKYKFIQISQHFS